MYTDSTCTVTLWNLDDMTCSKIDTSNKNSKEKLWFFDVTNDSIIGVYDLGNKFEFCLWDIQSNQFIRLNVGDVGHNMFVQRSVIDGLLCFRSHIASTNKRTVLVSIDSGKQ